jgi:hypothetical protein
MWIDYMLTCNLFFTRSVIKNKLEIKYRIVYIFNKHE